ncbi:hypothetical protein [Paenibacillus sp. FSL H8-0537]|uniref:hypothetical protein n=1 Tax=Paenibacillus sp. FSL H8-0537 TaxID=2921399 RepID=UPI003100F03A
MELILNELSLDGQFTSVQSFMDSLSPMIKLQKIIESTNVVMLRHHELYNRKVTLNITLHHVLTDNSVKTSNEIRVFKRLLQKLMSDDPFWTYAPKHSKADSYYFEYLMGLTSGNALAEACERDKVILSFEHEHFKMDTVEVLKNGTPVVLINVTNPIILSNLLWENKLIVNARDYCVYRYDETNLSFQMLEQEHGFEQLELEEIKAFLSSFDSFIQLSWDDILIHDGLQYKPYSPSRQQDDWFRNSVHREKTISKFRTSQKYRCYGYRENNIFHVIRFERDHRRSDHG